jgi:hypothetical protein
MSYLEFERLPALVAKIGYDHYAEILFDHRGHWILELVRSGQVYKRHSSNAFYDGNDMLTFLNKQGFTHNLCVKRKVMNIYRNYTHLETQGLLTSHSDEEMDYIDIE